MNEIKNKTIIYAIIATFVSLTFNQIKIDATTASEQYFYENLFKMSIKYKNYVDVFFDEYVRKFSKHRSNDHVIKTNDANISFEFLYNLSIMKLKTLREYFDDLLTKN